MLTPMLDSNRDGSIVDDWRRVSRTIRQALSLMRRDDEMLQSTSQDIAVQTLRLHGAGHTRQHQR